MSKRPRSTKARRTIAGGLDGAPAPATREELRLLLDSQLRISLPSRAILRGHASPLDYLWHAFEEPGAPTRDCVVWANRGGGKTFLGALATALDLAFKPGVEVRILAGSLEQARRMHAHLRRLFALPALAPLLDGPITERRLRLRNGSEAELLAQSHASVRGTRVQILRCDEVELFKPDVWEAAQLVTRSKRCGPFEVRGRVECFSTMHLSHGLMSRLIDECRDGKRRLFRWGVIDVLERCPALRPCGDGRDGNPAGPCCPLLPECAGRAKQRPDSGHIAIDDAAAMKARVALATWEAEMLCLRPRRTDAVYPEFDPARHVVDEAPMPPTAAPCDPLAPRRVEPLRNAPESTPSRPRGELLVGMDFGARDRAFILWARLDLDDVLWIIDERSTDHAVVADHAHAIRNGWGNGRLAELGLPPGPPFPEGQGWPPPAWIGADPAGNHENEQTRESSIAVLRRAGLVVRSRASRLHEGISLVRARLAPASPAPGGGRARPRLFIHRRCAQLVRALAEYHYPTDRPESSTPVKDGHDHPCDALRYLIVNLDRAPRTRRKDPLAP